MNAFDTNILVYSLDSGETLKQAQAQALLATVPAANPPFVLLWQVASELLNWLRKWETAGRIDGADADAHFHDVLGMFPLVVPTKQSFISYFELRRKFSLSHWDAMLLAACREAGVRTLYSEDLSNRYDYDGVVVVNPFA